MKLCLSGIESSKEHSLAILRADVKSVLISFYYAEYESRNDSYWRDAMRKADFRFVDSGAFTFRVAALGMAGSKASSLSVDLDAYANQYKVWLRNMVRQGIADCWVELDVGLLAGQDWLARHRTDMVASGFGHGLIKVWHSEDGHDWDEWIRLLEEAKLPGRSNYVAIEGHNPMRPQHDYTRYLKAAYDRGVKVHAFKMTAHGDLMKWPFYSVDSTSWLAPLRYGTVAHMTRSGGVVNKRGFTVGETVPVSRYGAAASERHRIGIRSAMAWVEAERRITGMWRDRGVDWESAIACPKVTI